MAWSTPDISKVTDALNDLLSAAIVASVGPPLNIPQFSVFTSLASPETARTQAPCQLSLYLLHVGRDPYWRNSPVSGPRPQPNDAQPLSLNLYYLLTAWADADYASEQQAMTIALQAFHSQPIYRLPLTNDEFTITVEADTIEEMSRLWQAFTVPMRLSCVVKVGVVFITPATIAAPPAPPPVTANIAVGPIPAQTDPPVLYAAMNLQFAPYPPPSDPSLQVVSGGELVAVGGSSVWLRGAGLDQALATQVFLSTLDGSQEWRVTAAPSWRQGAPQVADLELILPANYSNPGGSPAPPNRTPVPGFYRLAVGKNPPGPRFRSNTVPLAIAARIDSVSGPATATPGALYTLTGVGFSPTSGETKVALGTTPLTFTAAAPGPGEFAVAGGGLSLILVLPNPLPLSGQYDVGVVVNGVPCLPGTVVAIPASIVGMTGPAVPSPGALYTLNGSGFDPTRGATTVSLGSIALTAATASTPGPGQFVVAANGLSLGFALPDPLPPPGAYPLGVVVNGAASPPGQVVTIQ